MVDRFIKVHGEYGVDMINMSIIYAVNWFNKFIYLYYNYIVVNMVDILFDIL